MHSTLLVRTALIFRALHSVDKSEFCIHCRLHALQAAVFFYGITDVLVEHRESEFSVAPKSFSLALYRQYSLAQRAPRSHVYGCATV